MGDHVWDESDDVGIASMDSEHRALFALVNALAQPGDSDGVTPALNRLLILTRDHFDSEAALFAQTGYPGAEAHMRKHRHLMLILTRFAESFHAQPESLAPLVAFLGGWLMDHIRSDDRAFADYARQAGSRPRGGRVARTTTRSLRTAAPRGSRAAG